MRYRFIVCFLLSFFVMVSSAQQLTLDDLIPGGSRYQSFVPKTLKQLQWFGEEYLYQQGDSIMTVNPAHTTKKQVLTTLFHINNALQEKNLKKISALPDISVETKGEVLYLSFHTDRNFICFIPGKNEIICNIPYEKEDTDFDFSPVGLRLAVTNKNGLYTIDSSGKRTCIATDDNKDIRFGASGVHRNEFGISKGTFWSADGQSLAFYKLDESMVETYPLVDISERKVTLQEIKYPMAGMKSHQVAVGIYSFHNDTIIYLKTGTAKEQYQTNLSWSPDRSEFYIAEVNRKQDSCMLKSYNPENGKLNRILFTETDSKYVEPQSPPLFLNRGETLIWQSRRNGYNHLYAYHKSGKIVKQLTDGEWDIINIAGTDKNEKKLYVISTEASPLEKNVYCIDLKSGTRRRITTEAGTHNVKLSPSATQLIDNYSNTTTPRIINIIDLKKGKTSSVLTAANPFRKYNMPLIETGTIKAADGTTDLYYRWVKPYDFDPEKKYPAIVYVYGGPHVQLITNSWRWGIGGWETYMAEHGYIVFSLDNRGSANRGQIFENCTHRQLGTEEMKDQLKGVEWLKNHAYIDSDRVGVFGWSFGGFMATNLMLNAPDIFKVGVAGGPVIDWKYYEVMYGERYMGSPKNNKEGYEKANLNKQAGNLKGHLLLIHGDQDPVVVWQHSLSFLKSCVNAGTYPDYYVYPGHEHNVQGKDRVHLHEKITRYFNDFLKR